jgi:hypothetical protein
MRFQSAKPVETQARNPYAAVLRWGNGIENIKARGYGFRARSQLTLRAPRNDN